MSEQILCRERFDAEPIQRCGGSTPPPYHEGFRPLVSPVATATYPGVRPNGLQATRILD